MKSKALQLSRNPNSKTAEAYREIASQIPEGATGSALVLTGYDLYFSETDTNLQSKRPISGGIFEYLGRVNTGAMPLL